MKGSQLVIIGLLVLVVVGGVIAFALASQQPPPQEQVPTADPALGNDTTSQVPVVVATLEPTVAPFRIIVAVQEIPRGVQITSDMVDIRDWPANVLPAENAIYTTGANNDGPNDPDLADVIGQIARTTIYVEQPILRTMIADNYFDDDPTLGTIGSDAALAIPPNRVAVALPMNRLTSVAYAVQPGDRIDIIASLLFVDVDQTFQSAEPNAFSFINESFTPPDPETGTPATTTISVEDNSIRGAFDSRQIPNIGTQAVLVVPSEDPRPRLTVQRTVTDAIVIWVGNFPDDGRLFVPPTPTPAPTATPDPNDPNAVQQDPNVPTPVPPPTVNPRDIITIAVSPQDSVILTWFVEARIPFTFALRSAASETLAQTTAVTLDSIMALYGIVPPEKFTYTIEPAIRSIRRLDVGEEISLESDSSPTSGQ
jgi:Flp pilus assembly protein CpaB